MKDERFVYPLFLMEQRGGQLSPRPIFRLRNKLTACRTRSMRTFLKGLWIPARDTDTGPFVPGVWYDRGSYFEYEAPVD